MKISSIMANRYILDGRMDGNPLRLLINFDGGSTLRLQVAADGAEMIANDGSLEAPRDMGSYGRTDIADVTQSLFPTLCGLDVKDMQELVLSGRRVGVRLNFVNGQAFHFWADDDELHWGDQARFVSHDWLVGRVPDAAKHISV